MTQVHFSKTGKAESGPGKSSIPTKKATPKKATTDAERAAKLYGGGNSTKMPVNHKTAHQQPKHPTRGNAGSKKQQAETGKR